MGPVFGPLKGTRFWMFCEHFIRRAAGLGRAGTAPDPARYERMNAFCDVLVVGSGPAGLMAAKAAAEQRRAGHPGRARAAARRLGQLVGRDDRRHAGRRLGGRASSTNCASSANVRLLPRTTVWGYYDGNTLAALERVTDHKADAGKGEPRHRHWRSAPARWCWRPARSSGRWSFPATTGRA